LGLLQRENKLQEVCQQIFSNLMNNKETTDFFLEEDILPPFIVILDAPDVQNKKWLLTCFKSIAAFSNRIGTRIGECEGINGIIDTLQSSDQELLEAGLHFIEVLSKSSDNNKIWVGETSCIDSLLALYKSKKDVKLILTIFANLTHEHSEHQNLLHQNKTKLMETVEQFIEQLKTTTDVAITGILLDLIGNISVEEHTKKVIKSGATDILLDLLVNEQLDSNITTKAIKTMSKFATQDECVDLLVEYKVIEKLLAMLRGKVQLFVVVDMFTKLNVHGNFLFNQ
jgi:hypothetical protein